MQFKEILEGIDLWVAVLWLLFVFAIFTGLLTAFVKSIPVIRKFVAFLNDVAGEEARPGFPARPGLFDRIQSIEMTQVAMSEKVQAVHHELFPNSGKSLRDQTNRIESKVSTDYREISRLKEQVGTLAEKVDTVTETVNTVSGSLAEHLEATEDILKSLSKEEK